MPLATDFNVSFGWPDFNQGTSQDSKQDIIVALQTGQVESGAYGTDWSGVTATLPGTPNSGKWLFRINTDTDGFKIFIWDDNISEWREIAVGGGVTTTIETITTVAAGTPVNYGSSGLLNHTMQVVGNDNGGTFNSCSINFEVSLDGINFDSLHTIELISAINELYFAVAAAVKVRYNVIAIDLTGDADIDITITSK